MADMCKAMTACRPYTEGMPVEKALGFFEE
jgi:HD-GYP domain-containing protein (c-di-GMP phosphodiesterase class II)